MTHSNTHHVATEYELHGAFVCVPMNRKQTQTRKTFNALPVIVAIVTAIATLVLLG